MKQLLIDTLREARNKIEYQNVSNLTLKQRIAQTIALEKINMCIQILNRFTNIQ